MGKEAGRTVTLGMKRNPASKKRRNKWPQRNRVGCCRNGINENK